jgi:hypothetical protein
MSAEQRTPEDKLALTAEGLKAAKFRGPTAFYDGAKGMAQQDFECVIEPRFGYSWRRETRKDHGRQFYTVDGVEVADIADACRLLALPPADDSPRELMRRMFEEMRAQNFAECNANAGPFGTVRAWMLRASGAWHGGINAYADQERKEGREWPSMRWLYNAKHAMHETYRGMYLFEADRKADTGLKCALGKKCRTCPILKTIEESMEISKAQGPFPSGIEDTDIDAAKVATCIAHILQTKTDIIDGAFFSTKDDRHDF